jgi:DNA replication and repair protein RecF
MRVARLELFDFRNYERLRLEPGAGLNVLVGSNAQGKSNLLEALYALATTKSLRAGRDTEMVRFGADACRIVAEVDRQTTGDVVLEMAIAAASGNPTGLSAGTMPLAERKMVKVNGGRHGRVSDLIGNLNSVLFSSFDLAIVRGEPEERRRFLNYEIARSARAMWWRSPCTGAHWNNATGCSRTCAGATPTRPRWMRGASRSSSMARG